MTGKNSFVLIHLTLACSFLLGACCGLPFPWLAGEEPFTPAVTHIFDTVVEPTVEGSDYQPPILVLVDYDYVEHDDIEDTLTFILLIYNLNRDPLIDAQIQVILYDDSGLPLIDETGSCDIVHASNKCSASVNFYRQPIPEAYAAYNIFAIANTPSGEILKDQLSDHPISGPEGLAISADRRPPEPLRANISLDWSLPSSGYHPGVDLEARFEIWHWGGQFEEQPLACIQITELRQYSSAAQETVTLAEHCERATADEHFSITLPFTPSGFTWVPLETAEGTFTPIEISAHATLTHQDALVSEATKVLHLAPVEVKAAWWECDGYPTNVSRAGNLCSANIALRSFAQDPSNHRLQLSVRYTEQDPDEWLLGGFLLFVPCFAGMCEDEATVLTEDLNLLTSAEEDTDYSLQLELPSHPTGEVGTDGYFYLALIFDEITIWRGAKLASSP